MKHKPHNYWTKERVFEESKKYSNRVDFQKGSPTAYSLSKKNKWLLEMPHIKMKVKPNGYWNIKENVINASKECINVSEFEVKYSAGYQSALRNGWTKEMTWLYDNDCKKYIRPYSIYVYLDENNKICYVGLTNDKYERHKTHTTGLYRGKKSISAVFDYFNNNGILVPNPIYLEENLTSKSARKREEYWKQYYENELGYKVLNVAKCGSLGGGSIKWNKESVINKSKEFKTRTQFARKCSGAYNVARNNGWLEEMTWLISPQKPKKYWNEKTILEECKKYTSLKELRDKNKSCYFVICKLKLNNKVKEYYKGSLLN